jgi:hypothetical protein
VKFDIDQAQEISLGNALGEIVFTKKIKKSAKYLEIDLSKLTAGVYYLNIYSLKNKYLKKLILLR